jgi:Trk K+ transport system NAD-binding subunit
MQQTLRDGHLVPTRADTRLHAGDEVLTLTEPGHEPDLDALFRDRGDNRDRKRSGQPDEA